MFISEGILKREIAVVFSNRTVEGLGVDDRAKKKLSRHHIILSYKFVTFTTISFAFFVIISV